MKKILVLGATGFIGQNIIEKFSLNNDYELHGTYYSSQPSKNLLSKKIKLHQINLTDKNQVDAILKNVDVVIQAAAVTTGINDVVNKPYIHVTDNAIMNSLILRASFENKVKHVIFLSCTTMYSSSELPTKESDFKHEIVDKYFGVGWTKVYVEKMCEFYSSISDTKFTVIRHSNIYGPYDKYDLQRSHVFGATMTKVLQSFENYLNVWGDGSEKRDLLYVSDLVDFVEKNILIQKESFELINIGFGKAITIKELVNEIIRLSDKELKINFDTSKPTIKFNLTLDISKAYKKYNWEPKISLQEGIKKTILWYKKNIYLNEKNQICQKN